MKAISTFLERGVAFLALLLHFGPAMAQSGALDMSFDPGTGANSSIVSSIALSNGSYLIAGSFTSFNGTPCGRIARVLPDGSIDPTFLSSTGFNDQVNRMVVQSDGKIIVTGIFTSYDGVATSNIARLNSDGTLDAAFSPIAPNPGAAGRLEVLPDDRFILCGLFVVPGQPGQLRAARFLPDGELDAVLATTGNVNGVVTALATLQDGRIVLAGGFTTVHAQPRAGMALLMANGTLDTSFDPGTGFVGTGLPVQNVFRGAAGKIYAVGNITSYNGITVSNIVRLETSGAMDPAWNTATTFNNAIVTILELPNDKVLCGGSFTEVNGMTKRGLCALGMNGHHVPEFPRGLGASISVINILQDPMGSLLITGSFSTYDGASRNKMAKLNYCPVDEWYPDIDEDGAGAAVSPLITCTPSAGYVNNNADCNDDDSLATNGTTWYADADGDGAGDAAVQQNACTAPSGFVDNDDDCNDAEPQITAPTLWYMDQDGDGFGNVMAPTQLDCIAPTGFVLDNTDCNDFDPTAHTTSLWFADADGDGFGDSAVSMNACSRPVGHVANSTDCDDSDPLATEMRTWYADADGDGFGNLAAPTVGCAQPIGHVANHVDCDDQLWWIAAPSTWYVDDDGDGYGQTAQFIIACSPPDGYGAGRDDCDDNDPDVYPSAPCDDGNPSTHYDELREDCSCSGQGIRVSPTIFLDVPRTADPALMDATLHDLGLIPLQEPYSALGFGFENGVGGYTTTPEILDPSPENPDLTAVDWVVVELRSVLDPSIILASHPGILRRNGFISKPNSVEPPEFLMNEGTYYVCVRHRTHLGVITENAVSLDQPVPLLLFFGQGLQPVMGGSEALKPSGDLFVLWPGDVNGDGEVKYTGTENDRDRVLQRIGGTVVTNSANGYFHEDVNLDGSVKYTGTNNDRDRVLQTIGGVVPTTIRRDFIPDED